MAHLLDSRPSDSPYIERVWHSHSSGADTLIGIAANEWLFVTWMQQEKAYFSLQGPQTQAICAPFPQDAEFVGIMFKAGTFMPHLPVSDFIGQEVSLPYASCRSFWLHSGVWETPTYDNAEHFVARLVRERVIVQDPLIADILQGATSDLSPRTIQRRFRQTTGLNQRTMQQIIRARQAAIMLQEGQAIIHVANELGYYDQAHFTHAIRYYLGQTPLQLATEPAEMSLLYKTSLAR